MTALLYSLETADGYLETFDLNTSQAFLSISGLGAPIIDFQVSKGYKQHGQRLVTYSLQPRRIAVQLWAEHETSKQEYFDLRARMLDLMRPNRGGPMVLTILLPDMSKRSIIVRANPGPIYPGDDNENFWGLEETLEFVAFDPIFYDSDTHEFTGINGEDSELVFPIDFSIWFGDDDSTILSTGALTYPGTWDSYPVVTLTGPYSMARLENSVLSSYVALVVPIAAGEIRIINLTPGNQSILDGAGNSKFGELSADSNLIDFAIKAAPIAPGGVQTLTVTMAGNTGASGASLQYHDRFYAI